MRRSKGSVARVGKNRKRAPNLVWMVRGRRSNWPTSATSAGSGCVEVGRSWSSRQAGEAFFLEDLCHGDGADGPVLCGQGAADIVDGEVLLAQGNDALAQRLLFRGNVGSLVRGEEETAVGVLAELVEQDAETAVGVAETCGDFRTWAAVDDIGTQSLVLAVCGIGRLQEVLRQGCEVFSCTHKPISTMSGLEGRDVPSSQMCRKALKNQGFCDRRSLLLS
jgi:hypothetical protein